MNKILSIIFVSLVTVTMSFAQTVWRSPLASTSPSYLQNQGWNEDGGNYHRLPNRAEGKVRDKVWKLACQSAGLSIRFKTDAPEISVKYTVTQPLNMPHMPSTGVSGVDLYRRDDQSFCFGNYSFGDTIRYHYKVDKGVKGKKEVEYELFLPLYNEVSRLESEYLQRVAFLLFLLSKKMPSCSMALPLLKGLAPLVRVWRGQTLCIERSIVL